MIKTLNAYSMAKEMREYGYWSFDEDVCEALMDYYDEDYEFDAVEIACEWNVYDSIDEIRDDYSYLNDGDADYTDEEFLDIIASHTTVEVTECKQYIVRCF